MDVITYACWDQSLSMLVTGPQARVRNYILHEFGYQYSEAIISFANRCRKEYTWEVAIICTVLKLVKMRTVSL